MASLDCAHGKPVSEDVSGYYIAHEIAATFLALAHLGEGMDWGFIATASPPEFAAWLRGTARHVRLPTLKKHPRGPKKPRQKAPYDPKQPHPMSRRINCLGHFERAGAWTHSKRPRQQSPTPAKTHRQPRTGFGTRLSEGRFQAE
ncbi:hypothetical protein [Methylomagnum sp.]